MFYNRFKNGAAPILTQPRFFVDLSISDQSIVGPISANIVFFQCEKTKKRQSKVCAYPL